MIDGHAFMRVLRCLRRSEIAPRAVFLCRKTKRPLTRPLSHHSYKMLLRDPAYVLVGVYDKGVNTEALREDFAAVLREVTPAC